MNPILLLTLGGLVQGTELFVIAGILPRIAQDLGVGISVAGQLVTLFALVYAVGAPLLAAATGSVPRRRLLTLAMLAFAMANLMAALAPSYGTLLVSRVIAALSGCLFLPTALALAARLAAPGRRGQALAAVMAGLNLSTLLGVPAGILIADTWGWRWTFGVLAFFALLVSIGVRILLPEVEPPSATPLRERLLVLSKPGTQRTLLLTVAVLLAVYAIYTYLTQVLGSSYRGSDLAKLLAIFGVSSVAGTWLGGMFVDRIGSRPLLIAAIAVLSLSLAGFSLPKLHFAGAASFLSLWGLFGGAFNPAQQHRLLELSPGGSGAVLAWNSSAVYLGQALAGAIGGALLHAFGAAHLGWMFGAFLALSGTVLLLSPARQGIVILTKNT